MQAIFSGLNRYYELASVTNWFWIISQISGYRWGINLSCRGICSFTNLCSFVSDSQFLSKDLIDANAIVSATILLF